MRIINKILCFIKYRRHKFRSIGINVGYKSLRSNFSYSSNISIGDNTMIGPGADFDGAGSIVIGRGVIFAPDVKIYRTIKFCAIDFFNESCGFSK